MGITYGDHLIDSGCHDITPEQEREIEAREECRRRGLNPDDDACDGALVWMVVDQELRQKEPCGLIVAPEAKGFGADASDLITRLRNRAATASAVSNSVPEYALPKEVIDLLEEAADQIDHQVNVALAWKHTARSNSIALRDLEQRWMREKLGNDACCGTIG